MKNKVVFPFFILILVSLVSFAQDRIYYKNGNVAEAKILEISKEEIAFKKASNQDGPTYRELKSTIDKIVSCLATEKFSTVPFE